MKKRDVNLKHLSQYICVSQRKSGSIIRNQASFFRRVVFSIVDLSSTQVACLL